MAAFAFAIVKFCAAQRDATDSDVLAGVQALAETYKTLRSGIYFEKPPDARLPSELYTALTGFIAEIKQQQAERSNAPPPPRRYIEFLRGQFPEAQELKREESRIIVP